MTGSLTEEERILVRAAEATEGAGRELAIDALESYLEASPRAWRVHYLLGELRRQAGDRNGAIVAWSHADALHPLRDIDLLRLAALEREVGASASAAAHERRVARTPALLLERARSLAGAGAHDEALVELDALLATETLGERAAHARRLRLRLRHPDAERELERAGESVVSGPDGALAGVVAALEGVLAVEPDLWEAHFGVGLVARRQSDHARAAAAFRRVLALWPEQADARHELGVALLASERVNEALPHLEAAAADRPDDPAYLADAGFAQLRAGNLAAARDRLRRARALDADDPITTAYLHELARVEALVRGGR